MKYVTHICLLLSSSLAFAAENAQLVQTNVNVQNNADGNAGDKLVAADTETATASLAVQDVHAAAAIQQQQDASSQPQPQQLQPPNGPPPASQSQPQQQQSNADLQNVQLLKEANSQYQYQINSRYEERTRPVYGNEQRVNAPYVNQVYQYGFPAGFPYYKENNQYQELGNGQRRAETNVVLNDGGVKAQYDNQDQSSYVHQRSQSYSEYGKGEHSPDYNTYAYKRTYY